MEKKKNSCYSCPNSLILPRSTFPLFFFAGRIWTNIRIGWLIVLLSFWYWTKGGGGGQLKKSPCISLLDRCEQRPGLVVALLTSWQVLVAVEKRKNHHIVYLYFFASHLPSQQRPGLVVVLLTSWQVLVAVGKRKNYHVVICISLLAICHLNKDQDCWLSAPAPTWQVMVTILASASPVYLSLRSRTNIKGPIPIFFLTIEIAFSTFSFSLFVFD